jgi:hypothetical protein
MFAAPHLVFAGDVHILRIVKCGGDACRPRDLIFARSIEQAPEVVTDVAKLSSGWQNLLPANRSIDLQYCDRASFQWENAAPVHEDAASSARNILIVDLHPPQPYQPYAAVANAAREGEAEVESGADWT